MGGGDLTDGVGLVVKALLPLISPSTRAAPARDPYQHNIPQTQEQHPIKTRAKVPKNSATIDLDGAASSFDCLWEALVRPTSLDDATSSDPRDQRRGGWPWPAPPQAGHLDGLLLHHQPYLLLHPHLDGEAAAVSLVLVLRAAHTRSESQERNKTKSFLSSRRSPSAGQLTSTAKSWRKSQRLWPALFLQRVLRLCCIQHDPWDAFISWFLLTLPPPPFPHYSIWGQILKMH